jgi:2-polyprenyl-6-hydroxyphenyl methylase/3-demethylubiquinone-9 3-methyltransferase
MSRIFRVVRLSMVGCGPPQCWELEMERGQTRADTVDEEEVARFSRLSGEWWDARGPMAALHKFNPVRLAYIRDRAADHFHRDATRLDSLAGLRILDIGCGGGILAEPLARLGASVVGVDPSASNIAVARRHAEKSKLTIDYRDSSTEALAASGERFDVVLAMEVVEHVTNLHLFIDAAAALTKSGGLLFVATLNRTIKSFALAIVGAEYILRWLPRGTHQWDKFVTPNELEIAIEQSGLHITGETGVIYNLLADRWQLSTDMDVNYMVVAEKPA